MKIVVLFASLAISLTIGGRVERAGGGTDVKIEDAPFFVSVRREMRHVCCGAFISPQHILTAANCVLNETFTPIPHTTVVSGTDEIRGSVYSEHQITHIFPHEGFLVGLFWCNIAVIRLLAPVEWNPRQKEIALPGAEPPNDEYATLVAIQSATSKYSKSGLKHLSVKIKNPDPISNIPRNLDPTFYGVISGRQTLSQIDLGAPLVHERTIVGIVATTSETNNKGAFFVSVFPCVTSIRKAMAHEASSSSVLTSQTSWPAKRRRLTP